MTLYDGNPIRLFQSPRGRGVAASRAIRRGEIIERSPVIIIPEIDRFRTDQTVVFTYVFMWEKGIREQTLYEGTGRAAIALGLTSLLNHSYEPNAEFIRHIDELVIELRALRDIAADEEILIDYQMDLWFDPL